MNASPDQPIGPNVIRDMARRLRSGALLPEHQRYLADAFEAYTNEIDAGLPASLDKAFGLKHHGGVSPARADVLLRRDRLIVRLWKTHTAFCDKPPIAAAKIMHLSAERYRSTRWVRERNDLSPPSAEPAATWWRIMRLNIAIPRSKRLSQILQREIQDGV